MTLDKLLDLSQSQFLYTLTQKYTTFMIFLNIYKAKDLG